MQLTPHFTLEELTRTKPGIPNTPRGSVVGRLRLVAAKAEEARAIWSATLGRECPVRVSYGYRCARLNAACGGSPTSAHMEGLAVDLIPSGLALAEAFEALAEHPSFMGGVDQLIVERGCIHLGLPLPRFGNVPRRELRTEVLQGGARHYPLLRVWQAKGAA